MRLSAALKAALGSRERITLASGVLMARDRLSAEAARAVLLRRSRSQGRPLADVAAEVLDGEQHQGDDRRA